MDRFGTQTAGYSDPWAGYSDVPPMDNTYILANDNSTNDYIDQIYRDQQAFNDYMESLDETQRYIDQIYEPFGVTAQVAPTLAFSCQQRSSPAGRPGARSGCAACQRPLASTARRICQVDQGPGMGSIAPHHAKHTGSHIHASSFLATFHPPRLSEYPYSPSRGAPRPAMLAECRRRDFCRRGGSRRTAGGSRLQSGRQSARQFSGL